MRFVRQGDLTRNMGRRLSFLLLCAFLLSLAIRLAAWYAVAKSGVPPLYDEGSYLNRSLGAARVAYALVTGELPDHEDLDRWYGDGWYPPLFPLLLTGAHLFPDDVPSAARIVNVVFSSLTTVVLFLLVYQMTQRRNIAMVTALLHAVYPSFIGYSHLLWSETVFSFFLLLAVAFVGAMSRASTTRRTHAFAMLAGTCLGATALIRAAAIPLLLAVPIYVFWVCRRPARHRGMPAWLTAVAAVVITVTPWQLVVLSRSNSGVITSASGSNFYMGNNPWVPMAVGASFVAETKPLVKQRLEHAQESPFRLALREIASHPVQTMLRSMARFRMLISPDYYVIRHAVRTVYPPMPSWGLLLLSLSCIVTYWLVVGLVIRGVVEPRVWNQSEWLLLIVAMALAVGPILTVARSRYHQPILVVLLPFAAIGLCRLLRPLARVRWVLGGCAFVIFLAISASALPVLCRWILRPSSHYHAVMSQLPFGWGEHMPFEDQVILRGADWPHLKRLQIRFPDGPGRVSFDERRRLMFVKIQSVEPNKPAEMVLFEPATRETANVRPIAADRWRRWRRTSLNGVECMWSGPSHYLPPKRENRSRG